MSSIWVNHDTRLIFLGVPKNASTSIRKSLKFNEGLENQKKSLNPKIKELSDYKAFSIIRNPIKRFVSAYYETLKRKERGAQMQPYFRMAGSGKFIQFITDVENSFFDGHVVTQYSCISDNDKLLDIDFIIDFDCIEEQLIKEKIVPSNFHLRKNNIGNNSGIDDIECLLESREDLRNRISEIYKKDFYIYNKLKEGFTTNEIKKKINGAGWDSL